MRTATTTAITKTNQSVLLAAADEGRTGCIVCNNVGAVFYVRFGAAATTALFSVAIQPNTVYKIPRDFVATAIHGVWATSGGQTDAAMVTTLSGS